MQERVTPNQRKYIKSEEASDQLSPISQLWRWRTWRISTRTSTATVLGFRQWSGSRCAGYRQNSSIKFKRIFPKKQALQSIKPTKSKIGQNACAYHCEGNVSTKHCRKWCLQRLCTSPWQEICHANPNNNPWCYIARDVPGCVDRSQEETEHGIKYRSNHRPLDKREQLQFLERYSPFCRGNVFFFFFFILIS